MLLSHIGMAMAVKYMRPKTALWSLSVAALGPDLVHVLLVSCQLEAVSLMNDAVGIFPVTHDIIGYSHSLVSVGAVSALLCVNKKQGRWWAGLLMGHWLLDAIMYRHDLPIWMDGSGLKVGAGLLSHAMPCLMIEGGILALGLWLYYRSCTTVYKLKTRFWVGIMIITGLFLGSVLSNPKDAQDLIGYGPLLWGIPFLAWWIDYQRPQTYESLTGLHRTRK